MLHLQFSCSIAESVCFLTFGHRSSCLPSAVPRRWQFNLGTGARWCYHRRGFGVQGTNARLERGYCDFFRSGLGDGWLGFFSTWNELTEAQVLRIEILLPSKLCQEAIVLMRLNWLTSKRIDWTFQYELVWYRRSFLNERGRTNITKLIGGVRKLKGKLQPQRFEEI